MSKISEPVLRLLIIELEKVKDLRLVTELLLGSNHLNHNRELLMKRKEKLNSIELKITSLIASSKKDYGENPTFIDDYEVRRKIINYQMMIAQTNKDLNENARYINFVTKKSERDFTDAHSRRVVLSRTLRLVVLGKKLGYLLAQQRKITDRAVVKELNTTIKEAKSLAKVLRPMEMLHYKAVEAKNNAKQTSQEAGAKMTELSRIEDLQNITGKTKQDIIDTEGFDFDKKYKAMQKAMSQLGQAECDLYLLSGKLTEEEIKEQEIDQQTYVK